VVTGHDDDGKAVVVSDAPAPFVHVNAADPEWYSTDVWRTNETPARIVRAAAEPTLGPRRQLPAKRGTVLRINHFPPESAAVRQMDAQAARAAFAALGNEKAATFGKGGRHPLMHRTETVDYAIVLAGEITHGAGRRRRHAPRRRRARAMRHQSRLEQPVRGTVRGGVRADRRRVRAGVGGKVRVRPGPRVTPSAAR
jgi:hypothetical protein